MDARERNLPPFALEDNSPSGAPFMPPSAVPFIRASLQALRSRYQERLVMSKAARRSASGQDERREAHGRVEAYGRAIQDITTALESIGHGSHTPQESQ